MRSTSLISMAAAGGLAVSALLGFGLAFADGRANRKDVISADEIRPGMKGYGLTVFEGTKPERFEVEVIDVLDNFRPKQELILVKTHHPRLEVAKVVAGMSGSPIYLNGKMAGAYAYGWTFGAEPVAGVTPIRSMLDELERPIPEIINGWKIDREPPQRKRRTAARGATTGATRYAGALERYDLEAHARQVAERASKLGLGPDSPVRPVATPLLIGGMTGGAIEVAKDLFTPLGLEPVQAGGSGETDANAPTRFEDGSAIGVQLIRGDMNATGLGTVTRVEGDRLVAFGHPMMEAGVTALPTAVGRVLWFLASEFRSFKIGMPVRPVGALLNDRQAAIVVSQSAEAPTIPVQLTIRGATGAPYDQWNFEIAHEKFMAPSFMAVALGNAMQATAAERRDVSWTAVSKLDIRGYGEIMVEDYGVSVGGTPDPREFVQSNLVQAVGAILSNPYKPAIIERASMEIQMRYARDLLRLRGAEVLDSEIEAGDQARIRLTFIPYKGPPVTRTIAVPIPKHLAGQTIDLEIQPGYQVEREQAEPERLEDLISTLENPIYPPKSVVVTYSHGGGVSFRGHVAKNLPPGAVDSLRPTSATVAPVPFESEVHHVTMLDEFMTGKDKVSVHVKPVLR